MRIWLNGPPYKRDRTPFICGKHKLAPTGIYSRELPVFPLLFGVGGTQRGYRMSEEREKKAVGSRRDSRASKFSLLIFSGCRPNYFCLFHLSAEHTGSRLMQRAINFEFTLSHCHFVLLLFSLFSSFSRCPLLPAPWVTTGSWPSASRPSSSGTLIFLL